MIDRESKISFANEVKLVPLIQITKDKKYLIITKIRDSFIGGKDKFYIVRPLKDKFAEKENYVRGPHRTLREAKDCIALREWNLLNEENSNENNY